MDVNTLTTLISSIGFPIVMCLALMYFVKYLEDKHNEEISKLREVISNNTLVLQKLADKMEARDET